MQLIVFGLILVSGVQGFHYFHPTLPKQVSQFIFQHSLSIWFLYINIAGLLIVVVGIHKFINNAIANLQIPNKIFVFRFKVFFITMCIGVFFTLVIGFLYWGIIVDLELDAFYFYEIPLLVLLLPVLIVIALGHKDDTYDHSLKRMLKPYRLFFLLLILPFLFYTITITLGILAIPAFLLAILLYFFYQIFIKIYFLMLFKI